MQVFRISYLVNIVLPLIRAVKQNLVKCWDRQGTSYPPGEDKIYDRQEV